MDPVTGIGLAAAILTFAEVGYRIFSKSSNPGSNAATIVTEDIIKSMEVIRTSRALALTSDAVGWRTYEPLLDECTAISHEVLQDLAKIADLERRGKLTSLKKALISLRSEKHVDLLLNRLNKVQQGVILRMSIGTLESLHDLQNEVKETMRQLVKLNSQRPKELGYPWETGPVKDHLQVDDGLDQPFLLPLDLCSSHESFLEVLAIKYNSRKLPGRFQVANGQIMIWNWQETQYVTAGDDFLSTLQDWRRIKLAWALATPWWWVVSPKGRKCIRCRKPGFHQGFGKFKICKSCHLSFKAIEPTVFPGELRDMAITFPGGVSAYHDYRITSRSGQNGFSDPSEPATKHHSSTNEADEIRRAKLRVDPDIELVCHRLVVKCEPMFNIVHRYLLCRCISRKTSPASCEKEMTFFVTPWEAVCPRHNNENAAFLDYGNEDYHMDPYFDRFGGYDMFRFLLAMRSLRKLIELLGGQSFISDDEIAREDERYLQLSDAEKASLQDNMSDYWLEVYDCMDRFGVNLPPSAAEKLKENKLRDEAESPGWAKTSSGEGRSKDLREPLFPDLTEICNGTWNGKPHWSLEE